MEIFERIAALIDDNNISREEIAKALKVSTKQITRWKQNEAEMGIYKLEALCKLYGVSADYILGLPKGLDWPR